MGKIAFLFSGQGSQYTGMGRDLCENFPHARKIYECASDCLGFDVLKLSSEGKAQELSRTAVSQPLIFTLSLAAHTAAADNGVNASAVAGFSLGECSALTAAGAMSLETGFSVIRERSAAMQRAAERKGGAMYAVLGKSKEEIENACADAKGYVEPVNFNCPGQIVLAGEEAPAGRCAEILRKSGAKVIRLAVNAAFHSRLMKSASEEFYEKIKDLSFSSPKLTVYSNLTGDTAEISDIPGYLRKQMTSPVRFIDEMNSMARDGFDTFVEMGPGKTLCGFIRRGLHGAHFYNIEDKQSLDKCLSALAL